MRVQNILVWIFAAVVGLLFIVFITAILDFPPGNNPVIWSVFTPGEDQAGKPAPRVSASLPKTQPLKSTPKAQARGSEDIIQYDPEAQVRKQRLQNVTIRTSRCAYDASRTMLRLGSRSREQIIAFSRQTCSGAIMSVLPDIGITREQAREIFDKIAQEELDAALR